MKLNKMVQLSFMITMALTIFVIEAYLPPLAPIYGIKLGLANVITLLAIMLWGWKEGLIVFFLRVLLGSMLTGQMISFSYSFVGGGFAFIIMVIGKKIFGKRLTWFISALGGVFHNIGQVLIACILLSNVAVMVYLPVLLITGVITGVFTGLVVQILILQNTQIKKLF